MNLTKNLTKILVCRRKKSSSVAISLDRSTIAGLVWKEGAWSKISQVLHTQLLTQAPPLLKVLDPSLQYDKSVISHKEQISCIVMRACTAVMIAPLMHVCALTTFLYPIILMFITVRLHVFVSEN